MQLMEMSHRQDMTTKHMLFFTMFCCCSVAQSCLTLFDPMDCSMPGLPVPHHLLMFAQLHIQCIRYATHPSHPLMPSSSALSISQHQALFQWVSCLHQVTKLLELQLQHQSFQWIFRFFFSFKIEWFDLLAVQGTLRSPMLYLETKR